MENKPFTTKDCEQLIKQYLGMKSEDRLPVSITNKLANYYLNDNITPKEVAQCIFYYVEVRKKPLDPLYGVWFVPNIRQEAALYFDKLRQQELIKQEEAKKFIQDEEVTIFNIPAILKHKPSRKKQKLGFDKIKLEDGDDSGNN